jgi:hypothetical protein
MHFAAAAAAAAKFRAIPTSNESWSVTGTQGGASETSHAADLLRFLKLGECPGARASLFCILLEAPPLVLFWLLPGDLSPLFPWLFPGCHFDFGLKVVLLPLPPESLL